VEHQVGQDSDERQHEHGCRRELFQDAVHGESLGKADASPATEAKKPAEEVGFLYEIWALGALLTTGDGLAGKVTSSAAGARAYRRKV
jgi:hypothetical protein